MADSFESWVNSDTFIDGQTLHSLHGDIQLHEDVGSSWDVVQLGPVFLPGVVTVDGLEIGRDIDVHKKKGKEGCTLRDNGMSPITFDIICELTGKQWAKWLEVWPQIQPKEGGVRTPLAITHPLANAHGVNSVYIHRVKMDAPCARKGMKITIKVGKWFETEVESKGASKAVPKSLQSAYSKPDYTGDPNALAKALAGNAGLVEPTSIENVMNNAYENQ